MEQPVKRRKNIISRLGNRISRIFHRSTKITNHGSADDLDKGSISDNIRSAKSHDDLHIGTDMKKKKPNRFRRFLGRNLKSKHCVSESDMTAIGKPVKSPDIDVKKPSNSTNKRLRTKSPMKQRPNTVLLTYNINSSLDGLDSVNDDLSSASLKKQFNENRDNMSSGCGLSSQGSLRSDNNILTNNMQFQSELALKLGIKPKSPPSAIASATTSAAVANSNASNASPMSSLSTHSLLSGATNNVSTTNNESESLTRSTHDNLEDSGILADFSTPITKTTNASILDSTAARNKLSAVKHRRARPRASTTPSSMSSSSSSNYSPGTSVDRKDSSPILEVLEEESLPHKIRNSAQSTSSSIGHDDEKTKSPLGSPIDKKSKLAFDKEPVPEKSDELTKVQLKPTSKILNIEKKSLENKSEELSKVQLKQTSKTPEMERKISDEKTEELSKVHLKPASKISPVEKKSLDEKNEDLFKIQLKHASKTPEMNRKLSEEKREEISKVKLRPASKILDTDIRSLENTKEESLKLQLKNISKTPDIERKSTEDKIEELSKLKLKPPSKILDTDKKESTKEKITKVQLKTSSKTPDLEKTFLDDSKDKLDKETFLPKVNLRRTATNVEAQPVTTKTEDEFQKVTLKRTNTQASTNKDSAHKIESKLTDIDKSKTSPPNESKNSAKSSEISNIKLKKKSPDTDQITPEIETQSPEFSSFKLKPTKTKLIDDNLSAKISVNTLSDNPKSDSNSPKFPSIKLKATGTKLVDDTSTNNNGENLEKVITKDFEENSDVKTRINRFTGTISDEQRGQVSVRTNKFLDVQSTEEKRSSRVLDMVKGIENH